MDSGDGLALGALPPHEGAKVRLADGKDYVVPALTLGGVRRALPVITRLAKGNIYADEELVNDLLRVIHESLQRNYPDLTAEQLLDLVDLRQLKPLVDAIFMVNSLEQPPARAAAS